MKISRLYSLDDIRIEEIPVPAVGPGEALMKTRASGVCSGDVMPWYIGKKAPLVPGHEPAGEIVEVGLGVSSFKPGDRVFTHHHAPCLRCRQCLRGDYVQCETWKKTRIIPGGISEYILIPKTNLNNDTLKLPDSLSFEDGALIEPLACVVKGLKRARIGAGDTVVVIGLGAMGMLNIMAASAYGAGMVIGADMIPYRLKKAKELGASEVIDVSKVDMKEAFAEMTSGAMADLVIVGPNSAEALSEGLSCAGRGGTVLMFTPVKPNETLTLDPNELYFRDIKIVTSYSCGPDDTREALRLMADGAGEPADKTVPARRIITHRFPIEETVSAFRLTAEAKDSLKCLITF